MSPASSITVATQQVPVRLFAVATAVIVLCLYQAQPLVGMIARSLHLSPASVGLVSTLTLLGYACGLFVLVPLCDICENRSLVLATLSANVMALGLAACPIPPAAFLLVSGLTGFTAVAIQMLIPMAAAMAPEAQRGRVIGNIMSGLILGVLLSRPLASVVAGYFGWRASYLLLAVTVGALTLLLARMLPRRQPNHAGRYVALLASMASLLREEPVLRQRAFSALAVAVGTEKERPTGSSKKRSYERPQRDEERYGLVVCGKEHFGDYDCKIAVHQHLVEFERIAQRGGNDEASCCARGTYWSCCF